MQRQGTSIQGTPAAPERRSLRTGWTLRAASAVPPGSPALVDVPAAVPGCVHTDLLAAGLIPDPLLDEDELSTAWVGRADWAYRTRLQGSGNTHERVDLVCAGLDTVADLSLGGDPLGSTRNMHRSYRFDVTDRLPEGGTDLEIAFTSAWTYADQVREQLGDRPNAYPTPFNFVRKMAASFGWDWGPSTVTSGIWRDIGLHAWSTARLSQVRPEVTVNGQGAGRVAVHVEVERTTAGRHVPLQVSATIGTDTASIELANGATEATVVLDVADPALWWPSGYGEAALHQLEVTLMRSEDGSALDGWERRIGFRTVEVDRSGDGFTFVVNGVRVFAKGANWIPDDVFVTRVDAERYGRRVAQATGCGVNLLRVWGGGLYESDDFYDACDAAGVLVWQDFLFACAAYPEEEPLRSEVEAEAREAVVRLMPHPSLVLWNGNNENIWGFEDWGWQEPLAGRTWGEGYYLDLLPRIVAELDPTRAYQPGSPYSKPGVHPNDERYGLKHIWDVWNDLDFTAYRDVHPRFVAEFGWQAPPTWATLRRGVSDEPMTPTSPGVLHHQKADDGNGKLARGLKHHFPEPADFDDWMFLTQVNQARAMSTGIEHFRSLWPQCAGTVVWQLNDCWPVTSWAMVDGDERPKPVWYAMRRSYAERLAVVQPGGDGLTVTVVNDSGSAWTSTARLTRRDLAGVVLAQAELPVQADARSVLVLDVPAEIAAAGDPQTELLVAEVEGGGRGLWFFAEDRDVEWSAAELDVETTATEDGVRVSLTARTLVRDLVLHADRLHPQATVSDALLTLLPGESAELVITCPEPFDTGALRRAPVLRSVNDAVLAARHPG